MTTYEAPDGTRVTLPFVPHGYTQQLNQECCSVWKGEQLTLKIRHDQTSMKVLARVAGNAEILEDGIEVPEDQTEFDQSEVDWLDTLKEYDSLLSD
jgi:hypothetical protein